MPDQPKPCKHMWVRWSDGDRVNGNFTPWHCYLARGLIIVGLLDINAECKELAPDCCNFDITADTPDEKDCCKKCYAKTKEKTDA